MFGNLCLALRSHYLRNNVRNCTYSPFKFSSRKSSQTILPLTEIHYVNDTKIIPNDGHNESELLTKFRKNNANITDELDITDNEVLLEMDCVGLGAFDVPNLINGRFYSVWVIDDFIRSHPVAIGNEASGIVMNIGSKVTHLKVGDRVAIEPGMPCRYCKHCKIGNFRKCPEMKFCSATLYEGNIKRFYKHSSKHCFKLPEQLTMEEGSMLEPLAVAVSSCRRAGIGLGSYVFILGASSLGLTTLMTARALGATNIIMADFMPHRLEYAKRLGAAHTLLMYDHLSYKAMAKQVREMLGGCSPEKTIDCCGTETTIGLAIAATVSGGVCVITGGSSQDVKIPLINAIARDVCLCSAFRYTNDYRAALALASTGQIDLKQLITHHFDINDAERALETAHFSRDGAIKVILHIQPRDHNNKVPF